MVSAKIIQDISITYESLAQRQIDIHKYSGTLFDVVFEIITADSFVAGVASKILAREKVTAREKTVLSNPLLDNARWWRRASCEPFDLQAHTDIRNAAREIEGLRLKCLKALGS